MFIDADAEAAVYAALTMRARRFAATPPDKIATSFHCAIDKDDAP